MTDMDPSCTTDHPMRRPDVEWVELDGEAVLYDPTAQVLHRLNASAAAVWAACDGTASVDRITSVIAHTYSGAQGDVARDVPPVIDQLRRLGLLRPSPAEGAAGG
jgi:Coenzyme PQQ synthesis protein D (PqqD)